MKKVFLIFISGLLISGTASAERESVMIAWPYLVQLDFDAFHGEISKTCAAKYPETAPALKAALTAWKSTNAAAILELRRRLKVRFMTLNGFSEEEASKQIEEQGKLVTLKYLQLLSTFKDEAWNEGCNGKYAAENLQEMDFVSFIAEVTPFISRMTAQFVFPAI